MATRVVAEGLKPEETAVSKVMTRNPTFVAGDTLAIEALDKMVQGAAFLNLFYFSPRVLLNLSATRILMSWGLRKKAVTAEDGKAPFCDGAGKFRHLPVVEHGEVVALLDITKCLYDAIARMERAAEKGSAIAAAVKGVEQLSQNGTGNCGPHGSSSLASEFSFCN